MMPINVQNSFGRLFCFLVLVLLRTIYWNAGESFVLQILIFVRIYWLKSEQRKLSIEPHFETQYKYRQYPTITKPIYSSFPAEGIPKGKAWTSGIFPATSHEYFSHSDHYMSHIKSFPKITICLNSIHSKEISTRLYGEKLTWDLAFLYGFYGDNHGENFSAFWQKDRTYLDSLNLKEVLNRTRSDLQILNCKFMNHGCTGDWTDIETIYGVYEPPKSIFKLNGF